MKRKKSYTLKPRISSKGYPVHTKSGKVSSKWKKAHHAANRAALEKFGSKKAKAIAKLAKQIPEGELLGRHTRNGEIIVSKKVPKNLRPAVVLHEKTEHRLMMCMG